MSTIQFTAPSIHQFTRETDYPQWSKTLYLALSVMGWERFILESIDYTEAGPQLIAQRNMVMLTMESSMSNEVKKALIMKGYDNTSLDPRVLFAYAYDTFYWSERNPLCRYVPPGYSRSEGGHSQNPDSAALIADRLMLS